MINKHSRNKKYQFKGYKYKPYVWAKNDQELTASALRYKRRMNRCKHWYLGMVLESTGRSRLHHDLKALVRTYSTNTSTNQWERLTEKVKEAYDSWDYKY